MKLNMTYNTTPEQDALICKIAEASGVRPAEIMHDLFADEVFSNVTDLLVEKGLARMLKNGKKGIDWDAFKQ